MRQADATSILYDLVGKFEDQNSGWMGLVLEHCPETRVREPVTRGNNQGIEQADTTGEAGWYRGKKREGGRNELEEWWW